MNSTLKPVLPASAQNASSATSNKPLHPQGTPISYGQPSGPISQTPFPNTNMAHNHPATQQNHFSLTVPGSGSSHFTMGTIPASNHPVAISQPSSGQNYTPPKNAFSGFQHAQNQNTLPPVSQTLPATTTTTTTSSASSQSPAVTQSMSNSNSNSNASNSSPPAKEPAAEKDKAQPNGTSEVEPTAKPEKPEVQGNHVTTQPPSSAPQAPQEKPPTPQQPSEKPKPAAPPQEKKPIQEPKPTAEPKPAPEPKPVQEPPKVPSEPAAVPLPTPQTVPAAPAPVPEPAKVPTAGIPAGEPAESEAAQNDSEPAKDAPETDPLALDGSAAVPEEKSSPNQTGAIPIIESEDAKEDSEGDEKSSAEEEQSSDEYESEKAIKTPVRKAKSAKSEPKSAIQKSPSGGSKTKRQRLRTQHYQSPLPEIEIITKITAAPPRTRNADDKLIYFYKNEFLAVRNAEGGFYLCQAVQNIYKSSSKIKIRWLSQDKAEKGAEIYTPDFYDTTDFDCILTSLDLTRVGKGRYKLKPAEKLRTDSILKRCLAVEKGEISQPSVSAEHPDGLDLSLYKDEEQLKKRTKGTKRKGRPRSQSPKKAAPTKQSPDAPKARKVEYKPIAPVKKPVVKKAVAPPEPKKATPTTSRAARGKRKAMAKTSPVVDQKKAKVLAKIGRKAAVPAGGTKAQASKSAKVSKPAPSSSKVIKSAAKAPPRKMKRSGRK